MCPVAFIYITIVLTVIVARRVHALAATLALAASRMDFDGNPIADTVVDGDAAAENLQIGAADTRVADADQHLVIRRNRTLRDPWLQASGTFQDHDSHKKESTPELPD
jgi:hypothetical protein